MKHHVNRLSLLAGALALATACADTPTAPVGTSVETPQVANSAVKFWEAGATVGWNQTARQLIAARAAPGPTVQLRILAYLTLAQYNAVVAAEDTKDGGTNASPAAAVGGASVVVLKSFFPLDEALIDARLAEQLAATPWPGEKQKDAASGEAVGRAVGAAVVAYAATDNFEVLPAAPDAGRFRVLVQRGQPASAPLQGALGHPPVLHDFRRPVPPRATAGTGIARVRGGPRRDTLALRYPDAGAARHRAVLGAEGSHLHE